MVHGINYADVEQAQQTLLQRARYLAPRDTVLVQNALERKLTNVQIGRIVGRHPGNVGRRVHRLLRRLNEPSIVLLIDYGNQFPRELYDAGIERHVQGLSLAAIAQKHGISRNEVRERLAQLRGCLRTFRRFGR